VSNAVEQANYANWISRQAMVEAARSFAVEAARFLDRHLPTMI
jgi:hypothetical protein